MPDKPKTAAEYRARGHLSHVKESCLFLATKLGDIGDDWVVVGGLVPSLLVDQERLLKHQEAHVGTMDLDLGISLALLNDQRRPHLKDRLREAGFTPDRNESGNQTFQRWVHSLNKVTVDFLVPQTSPHMKGDDQRTLNQGGFGAFITPGLELAFRDRVSVPLVNQTNDGKQVEQTIWVCGPGAFIVLKALSFHSRGENKDAYDLFYMIRNYGDGPADVAARLRPLLDDSNTKAALTILHEDFSEQKGIGPKAVASFLGSDDDANLAADIAGLVRQLLREVAHRSR